MSLLENIKELCLKRGMTVAELERKLEFSNGSISKWNKSTPTISKLKMVADYFNVTVDYLIGGEDAKSISYDMEKDLADLFYKIDHDSDYTWKGEPLTDETRRQLKLALRYMTDIIQEKGQ